MTDLDTGLVTKRLFIGGLSSDISKDDLIERFSKFGKVDNVKLTTRLDDQGVPVKSFAHLDLEGEQSKLKKCFDTYQNTKWKGSCLKLQYAKESFLDKLKKEREKEDVPKKVDASPAAVKPPDISDIKGPAVPGTPLPGKTDWVVGKYGRVLPIMNLKKSNKLKVVKHDPSKLCHTAKIFKDESLDLSAPCEKLTWEIDTPDSDITKKRKGDFLVTQSVKKVKKHNSTMSPVPDSICRNNLVQKQNINMPMKPAYSAKNQSSSVLDIPEFKGLQMLSTNPVDLKLSLTQDSPSLDVPGTKLENKSLTRHKNMPLKKNDFKSSSTGGITTDLKIFENTSDSISPTKTQQKESNSSNSSPQNKTSQNKRNLNGSPLGVGAQSEDNGNDSASSADTDEIIARHKKKCNLSMQSSLENKLTPVAQFKAKPLPSRSLNSSLSDNSLYTSECFTYSPGLSDYSLPNTSLANRTLEGSDLHSNDFELVAKKLEQKETVFKPSIVKASPMETKAEQKVGQISTSVKENCESVVKVMDCEITEKKDKKASDNIKRLKAIRETSKLKLKQQMVIQKALEHVDSKDFGSVNRTVFASDSEDDVDDGPTKSFSEASEIKTSKKSKDTMELFGSSSDSENDYEEMFKSKPHFEGKKGEQLMKMERNFGDSRFKLDAKFVDTDSEEEEEKNHINEKSSQDNDLEEEKAASLRVLENVIGKSKLDNDMNTVRFDPTKVLAQKEVQTKQNLTSGKIPLTLTDRANKKSSLSQADMRKSNREEETNKTESVTKQKQLESTKVETCTTETKNKSKISDPESDTLLKTKDTSDNAKNAAKSRVDKSLLNLFISKESEKDENNTQVFSLLDQFGNISGDSSNESDIDTKAQDIKPKAVLTGLFKNSQDPKTKTTKTSTNSALNLSAQAGFRKGRSTQDQIAFITQEIEDGFQEKKPTTIVWVDLEKAFDKVWEQDQPRKGNNTMSDSEDLVNNTMSDLEDEMDDDDLSEEDSISEPDDEKEVKKLGLYEETDQALISK
uniref:RRM domain-containing protein n=1 Tax=Biomphalaria glabrata TaxID=6526 RepID=A0A2C9L687_BIOGL